MDDDPVVDLDLACVYASSELNAGGARATWWQPVNVEACRLTLDFFREHADEFGFRELGYREGDLPRAEQACREVVSLPIYPELTAEQQRRVVDSLAAFYRS